MPEEGIIEGLFEVIVFPGAAGRGISEQEGGGFCFVGPVGDHVFVVLQFEAEVVVYSFDVTDFFFPGFPVFVEVVDLYGDQYADDHEDDFTCGIQEVFCETVFPEPLTAEFSKEFDHKRFF